MNLPGIYDTFNKLWNDYQTVWIISDLHFNENDLKIGFPNRPSDEELVKRINAKVGRRDILLVLGDCGDLEYIKQLRGYKVLIAGNHDTGSTKYKREVVKKIYDADIWNQDSAIADMRAKYPGWKVWCVEDYEFHVPFRRWNIYADNMLFDEVYEGALIVGEKLILSHEPVEIPWLYNVHGHDHAGKKRKNHLNVCSDVIGYEPVNLTQKLKNGLMSAITTIHRTTIDSATERKIKRGGKKIGKTNKEN